MIEGQATATKSGAPDPLIGRVISDRFKITSLIARGGMGKVYRAEQAPLGRQCAIKVLNPNYNGDADPEFHRRFFREASITSKITHPNSVTIFDYGKTDDDIYFMAMEYLEGQTLHQALREGGVMNEIRVGRITSQICRALREAHKLGVIHRDLKPANIFLTRSSARSPDASGSMPPPSEEEEDFVKVLDFGLVKHLSERPEEQLTQTGLFMGSPKYMAPEQIQGGHVDERTDIYSLGIIMYEMLAGKVPFERATSVNILMAHVGEPPPPMRAVNPNLVCSPAFEEIVMSCIAKDPNERVGSMDHLLQAIRRAHGGSLTGQIAAVNISGQYTPARGNTAPPPAVLSSAPMAAMPAASGSHSMGILHAPANDTGSGPLPQPRSKLWIPFGVLVAAVVGGGLGMLAFQWTAPESSPHGLATPHASVSGSGAVTAATVVATETSAPAQATAPTQTTAPTQATAPAPRPSTLELTTEPPGASVREDGKEICSATPCDLTLKGDPSKAHKLLILRAGYKSETRTVRAGDSPVHVKLTHTSGGSSRPAAPPTSKPEGTTPDGFKGQPY
ncbi:MAG: serine/threonine protein kinase [Labilithrix sp.]|nr:serine/threonine protein kinase [Labilithrix sp.]